MKKILCFLFIVFSCTTTSFAQGKPYGGPVGNPVSRAENYVVESKQFDSTFTVQLIKESDALYVLYTFLWHTTADGCAVECTIGRTVLGKGLSDPVFFSVGTQYFFSYFDEKNIAKRVKF